MPVITLALTGGHTVKADVDADTGAAALKLATEAMDATDPLAGHLEIRPAPGTTTRIRLADIVLAELTD